MFQRKKMEWKTKDFERQSLLIDMNERWISGV